MSVLLTALLRGIRGNMDPAGISAFVVSFAVTAAIAVPMTLAAIDSPDVEAELVAEISTGDSRFPPALAGSAELALPQQTTRTAPSTGATPSTDPTPEPVDDQAPPTTEPAAEQTPTPTPGDVPNIFDNWEPALVGGDPTPVASSTPGPTTTTRINPAGSTPTPRPVTAPSPTPSTQPRPTTTTAANPTTRPTPTSRVIPTTTAPPQPTPSSSVGPRPTSTAAPTSTSRPTNTPTPAATAGATNTPAPTPSVAPVASADLSIRLLSSAEAISGQSGTVKIKAYNHGPGPSTGATATFNVSGGTISTVSTSASGWSCASNSSTSWTCSVASFEAGKRANFGVTITPTSDSPVTVSGTVGSVTADPSSGNNTVSLVLPITGHN